MDRARRLVLVSAPTVQDPYNANRLNIDNDPHQPPPLPDLPPVEAPSAGFVVQLFVIPAVVVVVVILVWLLFGKLAGGERDPAEYVRRLRQASGDWRSAFELASLIQNDAKLGSDPRLLGELTDLLSSELKTNDNTELKAYLIKTIGAFQTLDANLGDNRKVDPIEALTIALEPDQDSAIRMEAAASLAKHGAGSRASSTTRGPSRRWPRRPPVKSPNCARSPHTPLASAAASRAAKLCGNSSRPMRTALSATMPPWPLAGKATRQQKRR